MSYFEDAYNITMSHEGGYVNDTDDVGGETYKGISRKYNPSWEGWEIIDSYKNDEMIDFLTSITNDEKLQKLVHSFYKQKYFDPYRGDELSPLLAAEMFDTAVNMGVGRAVSFLQTSLNLLNRNGALYNDMLVDGDYGPTTHARLAQYMELDGDEAILLKMLNVLQGAHYINYMKQSPKQEKYARGWFKRVEILKGPK